MRHLIALVAVCGLAAVAQTSAALAATVRMQPGDVVGVAGTAVSCFAITSNGKDGFGCVVWHGKGPVAGSFGAGIAVDGTVVINRIKPDGTASRVFKRVPQSVGAKEYKLGAGSLFWMPVKDGIVLGCRVVDVTDVHVPVLFRGRKVLCYRATAKAPLANGYGIAISDRMAGVYRYTATSAVGKDQFVRAQPS